MGAGALAALGAAPFRAATNLVLREQVVALGGATARAWRTAVSALVFAPVFLAPRGPGDLLAIPARTIVVLLLSVPLSMVIGDILQFTAVRHLRVALTLPIASADPLLTLPLAMATLGESPGGRVIAGAPLVVAGVVLVALPQRALGADATTPAHPGARHGTGVLLAPGSAVCVAAATALTRAALRDTDILAANMLRLPFSAALCALISAVQRRRPPWRVARRRIPALSLAGLTGLASGLCYPSAIKLIGASATAILTTSGPVFGLLGAAAFLGERPTRRGVLGTLVAFLGIVLIV